MSTSRLPVTVITGYLGAGKTTLIEHLLRHQRGLRVAVIVNSLNHIDIAMPDRVPGRSFDRFDGTLIELRNGCVCCEARDDLLDQMFDLAKTGRFDHFIIEASGIAEPMPIAEILTFADISGRSPIETFRLDTMVTVVDPLSFSTYAAADVDLTGGSPELAENDDRTVMTVLIEQIEFANVIVVNKVDLVDEELLARVEALMKRLNPEARIVRAHHGRVLPRTILDTRLFDFERAEAAPGWLKELRGDGGFPADDRGASSFAYRARRPFHPERFWNVVHNALDGVIRSKGFFWLASRHDLVGNWSQAGSLCHAEAVGTWWANTDRADWPDDPEILADIEASWREPYGDRRQELVFIGMDLDHAAIRAALDDALLTDAEMAAGDSVWSVFADPFSPWISESVDEDPPTEEEMYPKE